jgi:hypothetical protein
MAAALLDAVWSFSSSIPQQTMGLNVCVCVCERERERERRERETSKHQTLTPRLRSLKPIIT